MPDTPDSLEAFENAQPVTGRELLRRAGFEPAAPGSLEDAQLRGTLWEFLYALAARRIFLHNTDRCSDRELYAWLHDDWLESQTKDLSPEAGWDCHVSPCTSPSRQNAANHGETITVDRDRFLPAAPEPPSSAESAGLPEWANSCDEPGEPPFDTPESVDPLGLNQVDREIRAERRKAAADDANSSSEFPFSPPHELFERIVKIDCDGWQRPHEALARTGVVLLPPDEITDETIGPKLWELLHELACRGFYILNSDHLSDREVYTHLWREDLRVPAIMPGRSRHGGWFHDFVGNGSAESTQVWLRFFASDEARARHAHENPETSLPPREKPRFNRDWRLPKGPF